MKDQRTSCSKMACNISPHDAMEQTQTNHNSGFVCRSISSIYFSLPWAISSCHRKIYSSRKKICGDVRQIALGTLSMANMQRLFKFSPPPPWAKWAWVIHFSLSSVTRAAIMHLFHLSSPSRKHMSPTNAPAAKWVVVDWFECTVKF